jgi:hypothetical protein
MLLRRHIVSTGEESGVFRSRQVYILVEVSRVKLRIQLAFYDFRLILKITMVALSSKSSRIEAITHGDRRALYGVEKGVLSNLA